jgi:Flp pilus assembly protein TadD
MPSPIGSVARFVAIFSCAAQLAACSNPDSRHNEPPPAMSSELVKDKDDSLLRVADVARDSADYPSAIRLYKTLLQNGDDRPEVHLGLGDCLFLTGAYTQAVAEYHAIDERSPKLAEAEIGLGRVFLAQHKPAEATIEFDGALKHQPDDIRALNGAGVARDDLGRHEEAQSFYQRGLAVASADRVLRNNYGLSLALSGNYAKAVTLLRPLVDEPGATARNRQNLALALALAGQRDEAGKIARIDLDTASVSNNLRFYEALRTTPAVTSLPASPVTPAADTVPAMPEPAVLPAPPGADPPIAVPVALAPVPAPPATAPVAAVIKPTPVAPSGGGKFAVQLAVYQKISGIAAGWEKYRTGFADIVGKLEPRIAMVDLGDGRGPLYRLKAGPFGSAQSAQAACQKLKAGGSDCRVSDFEGTPAQEYWKEHQIE